MKKGQKSLYLFALILCLRNLLQLEALYSAEPAENTPVLRRPRNSWQGHTMQEINSNLFLCQLAECANHVVLRSNVAQTILLH